METVADIIIVMFWTVFFIATLVALIGNALGKFNRSSDDVVEEAELEDDDPVFLFGGGYQEEY